MNGKQIQDKFHEEFNKNSMTLADYIDEELNVYRAAMREFVDRVDSGHVSSTYTYNKFKEILKR